MSRKHVALEPLHVSAACPSGPSSFFTPQRYIPLGATFLFYALGVAECTAGSVNQERECNAAGVKQERNAASKKKGM